MLPEATGATRACGAGRVGLAADSFRPVEYSSRPLADEPIAVTEIDFRDTPRAIATKHTRSYHGCRSDSSHRERPEVPGTEDQAFTLRLVAIARDDGRLLRVHPARRLRQAFPRDAAR